MTITIHISDTGAVTTTTGGNGAASENAPAVGSNTDGGAPNASLTGGEVGSASKSSETTDIGGPPQWLSEAIGNESAVETSDPSAEASRDWQEGGGPPEF